MRTSRRKKMCLQGYIHCIPYGNVSFVIKLSPLQPGYVMMVCASPPTSSHIAVIRTERREIIVGAGAGRVRARDGINSRNQRSVCRYQLER